MSQWVHQRYWSEANFNPKLKNAQNIIYFATVFIRLKLIGRSKRKYLREENLGKAAHIFDSKEIIKLGQLIFWWLEVSGSFSYNLFFRSIDEKILNVVWQSDIVNQIKRTTNEYSIPKCGDSNSEHPKRWPLGKRSSAALNAIILEP